MTKFLLEEDCYVGLTNEHLDASNIIDRVRSPKAGAIVLFAGDWVFHLYEVRVTATNSV